MALPASDRSFSGDVAALYESTLVPLIFEGYAADLSQRTQALRPGSVLEIACGTGVVTRALAAALPPDCAITATDLNPAMLARAQRVGTVRPVRWREADAMVLPFDDACFDVVVCQFGVMFFPDRAMAYREVRRVLRPGGTFLFNTWRSLEDNAFAEEVSRAVGRLHPSDPPSFLARTPHGHGEPAEIQADLRAAGFAHASLARRDDVSRAAGPHVPAVAYVQGTPLRHEILARDPGGLEQATRAAADALRARFGDGPIEGRISALVALAR